MPVARQRVPDAHSAVVQGEVPAEAKRNEGDRERESEKERRGVAGGRVGGEGSGTAGAYVSLVELWMTTDTVALCLLNSCRIYRQSERKYQ